MRISRDFYLEKLTAAKGDGYVKVVTGIRRCGKSYLLFTLFKDHLLASGVKASHIVEIALDSDEFEELRDPRKLSAYIRAKVARCPTRSRRISATGERSFGCIRSRSPSISSSAS